MIGRPRASHYRRHLLGPVHGPKEARRVPDNGQALTATEQAAVLTLINSKGYGDLAIGQIRQLVTGDDTLIPRDVYQQQRSNQHRVLARIRLRPDRLALGVLRRPRHRQRRTPVGTTRGQDRTGHRIGADPRPTP